MHLKMVNLRQMSTRKLKTTFLFKNIADNDVVFFRILGMWHKLFIKCFYNISTVHLIVCTYMYI